MSTFNADEIEKENTRVSRGVTDERGRHMNMPCIDATTPILLLGFELVMDDGAEEGGELGISLACAF